MELAPDLGRESTPLTPPLAPTRTPVLIIFRLGSALPHTLADLPRGGLLIARASAPPPRASRVPPCSLRPLRWTKVASPARRDEGRRSRLRRPTPLSIQDPSIEGPMIPGPLLVLAHGLPPGCASLFHRLRSRWSRDGDTLASEPPLCNSYISRAWVRRCPAPCDMLTYRDVCTLDVQAGAPEPATLLASDRAVHRNARRTRCPSRHCRSSTHCQRKLIPLVSTGLQHHASGVQACQ